MIKKLIKCPVCDSKLQIASLKCEKCGLELRNEFDLTPFDTLNNEQYEFLIAFLKNRGNMKLLQKELFISYPYAKKRMEELLVALNLIENKGEDKAKMKEIRIINVNEWNTNTFSTKASDIVKCKLKQNDGKAVVSSLEGKMYEIYALKDGNSFYCEALPDIQWSYSIFDIVTDFLVNQGGKAPKGNARNFKIGEKKCDENTVAGIIGISYFKKHYGESTFDPVFILAAILEWTGIVNNQRGFLELTQDYKNRVFFNGDYNG